MFSGVFVFSLYVISLDSALARQGQITGPLPRTCPDWYKTNQFFPFLRPVRSHTLGTDINWLQPAIFSSKYVEKRVKRDLTCWKRLAGLEWRLSTGVSCK